MIGVSDAAPPRAVNQPELAVDELSQICEGLARQRPENMPALLNALALAGYPWRRGGAGAHETA